MSKTSNVLTVLGVGLLASVVLNPKGWLSASRWSAAFFDKQLDNVIDRVARYTLVNETIAAIEPFDTGISTSDGHVDAEDGGSYRDESEWLHRSARDLDAELGHVLRNDTEFPKADKLLAQSLLEFARVEPIEVVEQAIGEHRGLRSVRA